MSELDHNRAGETAQLNESCCIFVKVNFFDVNALLDSRARKSCLRESIVRRFRLPFTRVEDESLYSATGEEIPVIGIAHLNVDVKGFKMPGTFNVVKNLTHEMILGCDFLKSNQVKLDFEANLVMFGDNLVASPTYKISAAHVRVMTSMVIPPFTEAITIAKIDDHYKFQQTSIIEPVYNLCQKNLALARCVVSPINDKVIVRMLNSTASTVYLKRKTKIGIIEPIEVKSRTDINTVDNEPCGERGRANTKKPMSFLSPDEILNDLGIKINKDNLTAAEYKKMKTFIAKNSDVFAKNSTDLPGTTVLSYKIDTGDAAPFRLRPYRATPADRIEIEKQTKEMLDAGIIKESNSPWSFPVCLMTKKDGTKRFCIDYRNLNKLCKREFFPLITMEDVVQTMSEHHPTIFSTLDLRQGYLQSPPGPRNSGKECIFDPG